MDPSLILFAVDSLTFVVLLSLSSLLKLFGSHERDQSLDHHLPIFHQEQEHNLHDEQPLMNY